MAFVQQHYVSGADCNLLVNIMLRFLDTEKFSSHHMWFHFSDLLTTHTGIRAVLLAG